MSLAGFKFLGKIEYNIIYIEFIIYIIKLERAVPCSCQMITTTAIDGLILTYLNICGV